VGDAMRDELRTLGDALPTTRWWQTVGAPYKLGKGTGGGWVELPDTVSNKTLDNATDVAGLVKTNVESGTFPAPDENTVYMLYFPTTTTILLQGDKSCDTFDGFHDSITTTVKGTSIEVPYAVMPRCDLGSKFASKFDLTVTASHELIEAATDPLTSSYAYDLASNDPTNDAWASGGGEVADLCQNEQDAIEGQWHVTRSWDDAQAAASHDPCVPGTGLPYFNAAVDTETISIDDPQFGKYTSDGYVLVARGASHDVRIDVFSDAPLQKDVTLAVGIDKGSNDPTDMDPILAGVDAKLSRTAAHNGQVVMLTLTVAASVSPQDVPFTVRAVNDSSDWHEWPVLLRIK
jgi:hypothetical protein